jgi:hypothetical protein
MDLLFQSAHKEYLERVFEQQPDRDLTKLAFGETSEPTYEECSDEEAEIRDIKSLGYDPHTTQMPNVRPILEFLKCSIC